MKNFSRIIDLGDVECVVRREGGETICVDFWMLRDETLISPTVKMDQPYWVITALFDGEHEQDLAQLARKALSTVLATDELLDDAPPGSYAFTGPSLALVLPPEESEERAQAEDKIGSGEKNGW